MRHGRNSFPQGFGQGKGIDLPRDELISPSLGLERSTLGGKFSWEINSLTPPNPGGTGTFQSPVSKSALAIPRLHSIGKGFSMWLWVNFGSSVGEFSSEQKLGC